MAEQLKSDNLIEIKGLKKYFPIKEGLFKTNNVKAVDDVSLFIKKGETLGLVGESGCGKTTFGRTILRLHEPTEGQIIYDGKDITKEDMLPYRRKMQIIFQDPYASLDPRMTVGDIVGEPLDIHKMYKTKEERKEKIYKLLETVGLNAEHANRFAHEFSGGQRQRIGIARALAVEPEFIVCDEPVSALDVSIQAQVVNMLEDLQAEKGFTYLFIAHDLSIVKHISNRIGVMYLGHLVELTTSQELYKNPLHPYTKTLLSAIPVADPKTSRSRERIVLNGDIPSPLNPPSGCTFRTRCPYATDICAKEKPIFREYGTEHYVACHNLENINN
ncbi:oligopeptide transport system ATP-binding protein [Mobilisporobacter senegalensis]|uniref:Oligopeptide transport system ATP-binding protein n=1 Tax=Mobilisporobacter senegalensis TaxID=1329262 RepID=A0A3N1XI86_9FIRM|nr:dipeptide ABC transporter ATP-binding protein [Mobilisporobacter senegalensis]ROR26395.1 oligopeptide transport system ATP-binding protein [Mobilisporobacter senegalensis]